jgi:hypothetical protein
MGRKGQVRQQNSRGFTRVRDSDMPSLQMLEIEDCSSKRGVVEEIENSAWTFWFTRQSCMQLDVR